MMIIYVMIIYDEHVDEHFEFDFVPEKMFGGLFFSYGATQPSVFRLQLDRCKQPFGLKSTQIYNILCRQIAQKSRKARHSPAAVKNEVGLRWNTDDSRVV